MHRLNSVSTYQLPPPLPLPRFSQRQQQHQVRLLRLSVKWQRAISVVRLGIIPCDDGDEDARPDSNTVLSCPQVSRRGQLEQSCTLPPWRTRPTRPRRLVSFSLRPTHVFELLRHARDADRFAAATSIAQPRLGACRAVGKRSGSLSSRRQLQEKPGSSPTFRAFLHTVFLGRRLLSNSRISAATTDMTRACRPYLTHGPFHHRQLEALLAKIRISLCFSQLANKFSLESSRRHFSSDQSWGNLSGSTYCVSLAELGSSVLCLLILASIDPCAPRRFKGRSAITSCSASVMKSEEALTTALRVR